MKSDADIQNDAASSIAKELHEAFKKTATMMPRDLRATASGQTQNCAFNELIRLKLMCILPVVFLRHWHFEQGNRKLE